MSRDANGNYTLPVGNPVISGTLIESTWANNTMNDLAAEMTNSLSRSGQGGMLDQLKLVDGTNLAPAWAFTNELNSGMYRFMAGDIRLAVLGVDVMSWTNSGFVSLFQGTFAGPNPDLVSTDAALTTGASDPSSGQHIAYGESVIQSKADELTASALGIQELGGSVTFGGIAGGALATTYTLYDGGNQVFQIENGLVDHTRVDNSSATPLLYLFKNQDDSKLAHLGLNGTNNFEITNVIDTATVDVYCNDSGSVQQICATFDAELGGSTDGAGMSAPVLRALNDITPTLASTNHAFQAGPTNDNNIVIGESTIQARNNGAENQLLINRIGGDVFIGAQNYDVTLGSGLTSGEVRAFNLIGFSVGAEAVLEMEASSNGGVEINNNKTGAGFERALTEGDRFSRVLTEATNSRTALLTDVGKDIECTFAGTTTITLADSTLVNGPDNIYIGDVIEAWPSNGAGEIAFATSGAQTLVGFSTNVPSLKTGAVKYLGANRWRYIGP